MDTKENSTTSVPEISQDDEQYYKNAQKYWSSISPDDNGMLGGLGEISYIDIRGSTRFLEQIFRTKPSPGRMYACDCGAGIGRVSKHLLINFFEKVDLVEQNPDFCRVAKESLKQLSNLGEVFNVGLQNFTPERAKYDVIWSQWVLGHLKDNHLIEFFQRCILGLRKNGMIIIKENFTSSDRVEFDPRDSSVTRPLKIFKSLIDRAGLRIVKEIRHTDFPKGLYPVYSLALRPIQGKN